MPWSSLSQERGARGKRYVFVCSRPFVLFPHFRPLFTHWPADVERRNESRSKAESSCKKRETSPPTLASQALSLSSSSLSSSRQPWRTPQSSTSRTSSRVRRVSYSQQKSRSLFERLLRRSDFFSPSNPSHLFYFLSLSRSSCRHRPRPGRTQQAPGDHSRPR